MRKTLLSLTIAALLPASGLAQGSDLRYGAKGFSLGIALNGSSLKSEETFDSDADSETGGGLSLLASYGFNSRVALFLEGSGAGMDVEGDSWMLGHGDLGIRYHFAGPGRKFVPFIDAAFTTILAAADDVAFDEGGSVDVEISGTGFSVGGGFDYFINPRMAFVTGLRYTRAEFSEVKVDNISIDGLDFDVSSTRLNLGLRWFFGNR